MSKVEVFIHHTSSNKIKGFPLGWYKFVFSAKRRSFTNKKNEVTFEIYPQVETERYRPLFKETLVYKDTFVRSFHFDLSDYGFITLDNNLIKFSKEKLDIFPENKVNFIYDFSV